MNNDDIKKYIDLSKLYTKVDLEKNEKVDEGILDWLENWLDEKKAKQAVDEIPADVRKDLDKVVDDNKLAGGNVEVTTQAQADSIFQNPDATDAERKAAQDFYNANKGTAGGNAAGDNFATDADGNVARKDDPIQPGGQDAAGNVKPFTGTKVRQKFDSINDAQKADNLTAGMTITIDGKKAEVMDDTVTGQQFFVHPGTEISITEPKPDGSIDAVGSEEDPEVTDQEGGVAQGMDQADAADEGPTVTDQEGGVAQGMDQADAADAEPANTKDLMTRYNEGGKKAMPEIKKLQTELSRLGFDPNGIDGKYGNGTFKAVQQFQKANGLQVDGQAGTNTLAAIKKAITGTPANSTDSTGSGQQTSGDGAPTSNDAQAAQDKADADAKAKDDPMTAANQQKDIDTAQPNADVDRYIELLNKLEGGQVNAGTPNATQGQVVASYDFRDLIALVESKLLNEQLTPAEEKELAALHDKVQGYVGIPGMDDDKITKALNRYLKLKKPASATPQADAGKPAQPDFAKQARDQKALNKKVQADADAAAAPKVSKELYVQMAPNRNASLGNFNVSQMKAKYPKPYLEIPNKDGTVTRGYGPLKNLEDFVANKGKKFKAKIIGKPVSPAATNNDKDGTSQQAGKPNAELDGAQRGVQTASKDNNMKKAIKEASMNISINGESAAEVAELAGILKNAGMHDAKPVSDILPRAGEKPAMAMDSPVRSVPGGAAFDLDYDGHDDMVAKMKMMDEPAPDDSPCGMGEEGVEEEWDNTPDESYADHQTMTHDLSGGINRQKKSYAAAQDGDNAMAVETSIREQLWAALNEKMTAEGRGRGKDKKTTEGSRGKKSRGKKSRG